MGREKKMLRIATREFRGIRDVSEWRTLDVVPAGMEDKKLAIIRHAGFRARKIPVQRNNRIVAYRIEIKD